MSQVRIIPLGVGSAFSAAHYTTCLLLGAGDDWALIDCPHPIRKMLREATASAGIPVDLGQVGALLLSHLHADHASGVEMLGFYSYYALGRRARVLAHPDVSARLWNGLLAAGMEHERPGSPAAGPPRMGLDDYFELVPLSESAPVASGPFSVECRPTIHPVPTTAFRIRALGRTLAFSSDTAYDPALIEWLSAADLIVHEATTHRPAGPHTPYEALAALPRDVRDRMRLIHYPDDFAPDPPLIEPLVQGRCYEV